MIKVYGIYADVFPQASFEEIITETCRTGFTQFDTETTGLDVHRSELICFQLGNHDNQYVIHPSKIQEFKNFLESKTLLIHNAKFDLRFLYKHGIFPRDVYDTLLAEAVIYCGIKGHTKNLADVAKRRLRVTLDKSVRDGIWKEGLTRRVVEYAADDVKWLEAIRDSQMEQVKELDLKIALDLENRFVRVLAYIEYCGFKLDKERWAVKCERDLADYREAERIVNQFIIDNNISKFISNQMSLFDSDRKTTINWASPKQVIELFKTLNIPVAFNDAGEMKESVAAKNINRHISQFPFIQSYLDFKEKQKLVSTYGYNFIEQINPNTGRLHTNFTQIMDTGRLSSGGKNRSTREEYLNFQNIPSDEETRSCFISDEGNVLVVADYSGQEQVVLANFSLDPGLLEFYDKGLSDMHCFVASKMYPELEGLSAKEIKSLHSEKRQEAKIAGFAINYGGNAQTIAAQLNKSIEDGERVYNGYFLAFPGLPEYFEKSKRQGLRDGFILISPITSRKSFIYSYENFKKLKQEINKSFWERWRVVRELPDDSNEKQIMQHKIKTYFLIKGTIERKSLNYPIQGSSAEITKISCIYFFDWILKNNLQAYGNNFKGKLLMANTVHDENIVECPIEMAGVVKERLQRCMEKAGAIYCKRVPLKAVPNVTDRWAK